ncbi:MAG: glycosyltransferase family 4 protein [bacterium]
MKIFYLCYEDVGNAGAATTHLREVAENLQSLGHNVRIIVPLLHRFRFPVRAEVVYVPLLPLGRFKELGYYFFLWFTLISLWLKKGVDLLYVREMTLNVVPFLFAKLFRKRIVVEINGLLTEELKLAGVSNFKIRIIRFFRRINLALSDKIVTVSKGLKHHIATEYGYSNGKLVVVENGANPHLFAPMDKLQARRTLRLDENGYYLCYVGSFYPHHGLEQTLLIFQQLLTFQPETKLLLIGDGLLKGNTWQRTRQLGIENNVLFLHQKLHTDIPKYICASDACLLLFNGGQGRIPGISLKILEYMACSRPVVAAVGEESGRFVQSLNSGIVVDPQNPEKAAIYIHALLTNETLKEKLGALGRNAIVRNYTWQHTAQRLQNVCIDLI